MKRALDAAVVKQGVYTLVFHPTNGSSPSSSSNWWTMR